MCSRTHRILRLDETEWVYGCTASSDAVNSLRVFELYSFSEAALLL